MHSRDDFPLFVTDHFQTVSLCLRTSGELGRELLFLTDITHAVSFSHDVLRAAPLAPGACFTVFRRPLSSALVFPLAPTLNMSTKVSNKIDHCNTTVHESTGP
jgi:hypothetical protein